MPTRILLQKALPGRFPGWRFRRRDFGLLALRLLPVFPAYTLSRVLFAALNPAMLAGATSKQVLEVFWTGLRFDVSTVFSVNAPLLIIMLLPLPWRERSGWRMGLKTWYVFSNTLFLLMDLADAEYARYTGRRTGADVLGILPDIIVQLPQLLSHFWYIPLIAIGFGWLFAKVYAEAYRLRRPGTMNSAVGLVAYVAALAVCTLGIRGTVDLRPLSPGHAYALRPSTLGTVALNTPFTFFKSLQSEPGRHLTWAGSTQEALAVFRQDPGPAPEPPLKGYNVVVILLESFGTEYTGLEGGTVYTPFLDSLAHAGTWFPHFYANGRRSIEALPAVLAGLPNLEEEAFITGAYSADKIHGWAEQCGQAGYATTFYHGGRNGTMGFDAFSAQAGFNRYVGLDQYPNRDTDYDGNWGIFDRPFLQFVARDLSATKQPFVTGIFTLSSHQPYTIEPGYEGKFPKGTLPIHESIGYADEALRQFFTTARKQPWFANTLFVLTADHSQMATQKRFYGTPNGWYDIPCILYAPGKTLALDTAQVRQQADIGPTVLDLIGLPSAGIGIFANSMARPAPSRVLEWTEGRYYYLGRDGYLSLTPEGKAVSTLAKKDSARALRLLKAGTQLYTEGLRENRLYP